MSRRGLVLVWTADCSRSSAAAALKGGDKDAADRKEEKNREMKSNSRAKLQETESAERLFYQDEGERGLKRFKEPKGHNSEMQRHISSTAALLLTMSLLTCFSSET